MSNDHLAVGSGWADQSSQTGGMTGHVPMSWFSVLGCGVVAGLAVYALTTARERARPIVLNVEVPDAGKL